MAAGGKRDRKHDELVRGQDNILTAFEEGKKSNDFTLETMTEQLSDIQRTLKTRSSREDQSGAGNETKETVAVQETDKGSTKKETSCNATQRKKLKLSKEMPLKMLWTKQDFRDKFTRQMNVKYNKTNAKHWPFLGEEFGIEGDTIETFRSFDYPSPSESMFQTMELTDPTLKIEGLCKALEEAEAFEVLGIVNDAIEGKQISRNELVSDMWDKSRELFEKVILNLDKNRVWEKVGVFLGFTKRDCQSFERDMDPALNLTSDLFDVLRTQRPRLKVKDFKEKLKDIKKAKGVLKILEDDISGDRDMLLRELFERPNVMLEIEHILNDPKNESLWHLAKKFKDDGVCIDVDMFRHRGTVANPTHHLMEYVIASFRKEQKIKHLIMHLLTIHRKDCLGTVAEYLEGGDQEVEEVFLAMPELKRQLQICEEREDASEQDSNAGEDSTTNNNSNNNNN